jgi:hypothetical protein
VVIGERKHVSSAQVEYPALGGRVAGSNPVLPTGVEGSDKNQSLFLCIMFIYFIVIA